MVSTSNKFQVINLSIPMNDYRAIEALAGKHAQKISSEFIDAVTSHIERDRESFNETSAMIMQRRINQASHDIIALRDAYMKLSKTA